MDITPVTDPSSYREAFPQVAPDLWFPSAFDFALLGMAERLHQLQPIYSGVELLRTWKTIPAATAWERYDRICRSHPQVLILQRPARTQFWRRVREKQFLAWELMTPAIVGVAAYANSPSHAVVYDRTKVLSLLSGTVSDSENVAPGQLAIGDYSNKLLSCNAGARAPWYLFTL